MSKYGHMVKFNGKYYKAGEEVPDDIQSPKAEVEPPKKEEQKKPEPVKSVSGNNPATQTKQAATVAATERPQMKPGK